MTAGKVRTLVLKDKEVIGDVLARVQQFLLDSQPNDRVVLYIAGHGMLDDKLEYRFAPAGFDVERITETGISMPELVATLQQSPARRRLLLLDTCHSGVVGEEDMDKLALAGVELPPGVRAVQNRGMKVRQTANALKAPQQKKRYIEDFFTMGTEYRGVNIIAGSAGAEFALEAGEWNNGVFAAAIMQAITDRAATDRNGDATLTVDEILARVQGLVPQLTGGAQKPSVVMSEDGAMPLITPAMSRLHTISKRLAGYDTDSNQKQELWASVREWANAGCTPAGATEVMRELAAYHMPIDVFTALLQQGADASAGVEVLVGKCGMYGCGMNDDILRCIQLLLSSGVDVNACNEQGETALHAVTQNLYDFNLATKSPLIDELLRKGADINLRDKNGKRPADGNMGKFRSYLEQRARQLSGSSSAPDGAAPEADFAAGVDWQFGKNGKTKNLAKAAECYQRAAAAGHAGAQNNIGHFYH